MKGRLTGYTFKNVSTTLAHRPLEHKLPVLQTCPRVGVKVDLTRRSILVLELTKSRVEVPLNGPGSPNAPFNYTTSKVFFYLVPVKIRSIPGWATHENTNVPLRRWGQVHSAEDSSSVKVGGKVVPQPGFNVTLSLSTQLQSNCLYKYNFNVKKSNFTFSMNVETSLLKCPFFLAKFPLDTILSIRYIRRTVHNT